MKTGFFGGTFSPPHNGHVRAARLFSEKLGLDRLIVIPDALPPHKDADKWGTAVARLDMTRLAFSSFAEVSDCEIVKGGRSYTVDTVAMLLEKYPEDELFMLVGEDMFLSFESWKEPQTILSSLTLVSLKRESGRSDEMEKTAEKFRKKYGAKIVLLDDAPLEVSSSEIRSIAGSGGDISDYVPDSVARYIKERGLYRQ